MTSPLATSATFGCQFQEGPGASCSTSLPAIYSPKVLPVSQQNTKCRCWREEGCFNLTCGFSGVTYVHTIERDQRLHFLKLLLADFQISWICCKGGSLALSKCVSTTTFRPLASEFGPQTRGTTLFIVHWQSTDLCFYKSDNIYLTKPGHLFPLGSLSSYTHVFIVST